MSNIVRYTVQSDRYSHIPGQPIAYWVSNSFANLFKEKAISSYGDSRQGLITGDNERFLKMWFEPNATKISLFVGNKWFPYNKGGLYRKWYGNNDLVVNWQNDGFEIKNHKDKQGKLLSRPQNLQYYFRQSITWTALTSGLFNARYSSDGFIFDAKGSSFFVHQTTKYYSMIAYFNSKVTNYILKVIAPTLDYNAGVVAKLPYIDAKESSEVIDEYAKSAISDAKKDWDSFETSWDFKKHPLI